MEEVALTRGDPLTWQIEIEDAARASRFGRDFLNGHLVNGAAAVDISGDPGRLIVLEGTDGAGRSTHIALLREWLESSGFGVAHTALKRSRVSVYPAAAC